MEQNKVMLLVTAILGALAILFTIISVATEGWPVVTVSILGKTSLFKWGNAGGHNYTSAGVLLIIAIIFTTIASLLTVLFLTRFINSSADRIKCVVFTLFVIAGIFIVIAYSRAAISEFYSYHLAVTAGILVFLSTIFFTYWMGRTSIAQPT